MKIMMIFARSTAAAVLVGVASIAIIVGGNSGCPTFLDSVNLSGGREVPPNTSTGSGSGRYELSVGGSELRFVITAEGLSGPVTEAHFHVVSPNAVADPVVLDLAPFLTEVDGQVAVAGASSLTEWSIGNALEEILAHQIYVNLHTETYPDGEIRGWVMVSP